MAKQKRVRWDDSEKKKLIKEGAFQIKQTNCSLLQAIKKAQKALPPERRRNIVAATVVVQ